MSFIRIRWVFSGLLLVASVATASGQFIYKWKDAGGSVHFTDTPPPPDATLLKGPKPSPISEPKAALDDKPMLHAPCRPDISAADCDAARRALQADLEDLERTSQQVQENSSEEVSENETRQRMAGFREKECSQSRTALRILLDRQNGKLSEILTEEELVDIPGQIAVTEREIVNSCD